MKGSIEAPGNESSSKLSVLITLRTAAMDQSYLTRQAVVGNLQNKDVGYLEVQWYLQYLT